MTNPFDTIARQPIDLPGKGRLDFYSVPALEASGVGAVSRLPVVLRVVLESVLRHCDGRTITADQVRALANWKPNAVRTEEVPFTVGRLALNCAAGIPLLGDVTAIRGAMNRLGLPVENVQPEVHVDMALDHTLTVDYYGNASALLRNMELDIERNYERYRFVKWAMQAYDGIRLFPPGAGILHQLNLEFLAPGFLTRDGVAFPDTMVATDSHTCMIAGLGTVGWGVGGIEAQAALLGLPNYFLTPDVVGVHVTGALRDGVTATDLVLHVTEMLREAKVVGKFVEFFGEGVGRLSLPDRATISNMAPEYGATIGYFPVDEQTCRYLRQTGRDEATVAATEKFYRAQGCFGAAEAGSVEYSRVVDLDLTRVEPCVAGPKRPQDRVPLGALAREFTDLLERPEAEGGYGRPKAPADAKSQGARRVADGDVVIAAITSCTNTSNPSVMLAAGLVAKKAVELGLKMRPSVKTSLTPGSRVVSKYLEATGLQDYLDELGFAVVGYSCATCVGASGPIDSALEEQINENGTVACAVLSGNRNFEARIHPAVRASFLASPPLVVAFALAGTVNIDLTHEPLGHAAGTGEPVYLSDIWPTQEELAQALATAADPAFYRDIYDSDFESSNPYWAEIPQATGSLYPWEPESEYLKEPPFLDDDLRVSTLAEIRGARSLVILGDSVTTDHISPIGTIGIRTPAGKYLAAHGVAPGAFNNYGARRMNHEVMIRGAFANVRLRNLMVPGIEGGMTLHQPDREQMTVFDAAMRYREEQVPLIVMAGEEYGTGSARDWAAKGTRLLGVRAVIASSFERIHRSNLVGMGVLPCQWPEGVNAQTLGLTGAERFDILGIDDTAAPGQPLRLVITRDDREPETVPIMLRVDTPIEFDYLREGGLIPFVLKKLIDKPRPAPAREKISAFAGSQRG